MNRNQIIGGCLIGVCSLSLGFGLSSLGAVGVAREALIKVQQVKEDVERDRKQTDSRIAEVAGLVKTVLEVDKERQKTLQEFIQILRVQNELLQRKNP